MENKPISEIAGKTFDYIGIDEAFSVEPNEEDSLEHHGVIGMKWGVRRYQPYSLVPRRSGKGGKETGAAKKSKSTNVKKGPSVVKKKSRKQTQEEVKAKKVSELQTAKQRKEAAQKILNSGDAKAIYENRDSFTTRQMAEAIDRINTEAALRSIVAQQNPSGKQKLKKTVDKVINNENLQKTADMIEKGINVYNQTARVANTFRDPEHQLKYVGKAENPKKDDIVTKEIKNIIRSNDVDTILANQSKLSSAQLAEAKKRMSDLSDLRGTELRNVNRERKEYKDSYQFKNDRIAIETEDRQNRVDAINRSIRELNEYKPGGSKDYLNMSPSPQEPTKRDMPTARELIDKDSTLFTPSSEGMSSFDNYATKEAEKRKKR